MREYTKAWVNSCLLYLISLISYALMQSEGDAPLSLFRSVFINILCLYSILAIFRASCLVDNIPIKKFWNRYPLLLILCGLLLGALQLPSMIVALPFYAYELLLIAASAYTIAWKWRIPVLWKSGYFLLFSACGLCQIYSNFLMLSEISLLMIGVNVLFLLVLNFSYAILYQKFFTINQAIRNDYLSILAEKAVDIIFYYTLRPYPRFTFISPSVENIVGYKQSDFYRNPKLHLELTHEQDRQVISKAFSSEADAINKNYVRWQRSDSEFIYLEFHNTPIFSGDELIAIEGILRDITDRKIAEQEMIDSKKSKQLLLSYISHELKTPITYIVGYAEALQNNLFADDEERRSAIDLIFSKSIFLQNLVEDLFQLSKMESNQFSFEFMQTKVHTLCRDIAEKHKNDLSGTRIKYLCQIDDSLKDERFEVLVDRKRIQQVFSNLFSNAIDHTPDDGMISLKCSLDDRKENVVFQVADSGSGIAEEDLPYIFKAFYRGKYMGEPAKSGSGLGLSLSRQIMQAHKGNIEARSAKGKGSSFTVTLPLYREEVQR